MKTGNCYLCRKELVGNIEFSHQVQCWVCSEGKALYYLARNMTRKADWSPVAGRTGVDPYEGLVMPKNEDFQAVEEPTTELEK